jgi:HD-GYP domain-containing protein (c-di-GMP phosphodiesterase class II)
VTDVIGVTDVTNQPGEGPLRLAELTAALSVATDLGMGQPMEHALRSCVLALRLGELLGMSAGERREVYYQALLRYIGCNAQTYEMADRFGDELALRRDFATVDTGQAAAVVALALRHVRQAHAQASPPSLERIVADTLQALPSLMKESFTGHCEVARRLAARLGFGPAIIAALDQLYERWDGHGLPNGRRGTEIAPAVLLVTLAQDAVAFYRPGGLDAAVQMARDRQGTAYDPAMVDRFCAAAPRLLAGLDDAPAWETVVAMEPGPPVYLSEAQFDAACAVMADFADIKSPYTLGHSQGVAALAGGAAQRCGLPAADALALRRAGLLHEIGQVGVSAGVWTKAGALSDREWDQVRLHPYYTERVLARPGRLARLGRLASHHHERLDGSGYHRGVPAPMLSPAARILAAADAYQAMTEPRPHRPARGAAAAADELRREVRAGRLDGAAVDGVLAAAGHRVGTRHRQFAAGLTEREVEVLRLVARGNAKKRIAAQLVISEKTVDNHIQHIYEKIGVSTRAGATLFAMEHDLLAEAG